MSVWTQMLKSVKPYISNSPAQTVEKGSLDDVLVTQDVCDAVAPKPPVVSAAT